MCIRSVDPGTCSTISGISGIDRAWLVGINNLVAAAPGATTVDYKFGTLCGGMLLSDARFIRWLTTQTHGTLGQSSGNGEMPLPGWALGALGVGLAGRLFGRPPEGA